MVLDKSKRTRLGIRPILQPLERKRDGDGKKNVNDTGEGGRGFFLFLLMFLCGLISEVPGLCVCVWGGGGRGVEGRGVWYM